MDRRMARMFNPRSGRCLDVAVDHGMFGEPSFLTGIEDMTRVIGTLVDARPDAIQLAPGSARLLQGTTDRDSPPLILRGDIANVYGAPPAESLFSMHIPDLVERAVRLDAVAVVVNLLDIPGDPDIRRQCIATINAVRADCDRYAMPLMIEPLAMRIGGGHDPYQINGDIDSIVTLVRQARELGADIVKADPCDDIAEYHRAVEVAGGAPVLVRGGGRVGVRALLERTSLLLAQGVRGVAYGRNIIQHPNPSAIVRALLEVLHDERPIDEVMSSLEGSL